ncbi:MAG: protein translocase subunit SecD [Candidatus Levybacteria bacterium]|nr:protein translocase subunit SecD [Candidatus Levybacteria bacterium]
MRQKPRFLLWLIIVLTIFAVIVNFPVIKTSNSIFKFLAINKGLDFRKGLDLAGGTSITYKANMSSIPNSQRNQALESAKTIIEKRINLFGVSEPLVQTANVNGEGRIIVELPSVNIDQAKRIIGTTASLSFWEEGASGSAKLASSSAYPLGILETLGPNAIKTDLGGRDLQETSVTFDSNTGKPQVQLSFTSSGSQKFANITTKNVNKIVAIVLDDRVIEAPRVNTPILNGNAVITGGFTFEQAKDLSTQLNAGALPVPLIPLEQHTVDATLGSTSLNMSLFAGALGFIIIVIFMSVSYGRLGILASVALSLYALFVLTIFKISALTPYGITLTLSGVAGFILSIGMAVDANILIFERIKEETRLKKPQDIAIELGFSRAWASIRDSNISTLITSAILYQFGTGTVRGFALVLAIGVLVSMFSAIVITRTFLRYGYNR